MDELSNEKMISIFVATERAKVLMVFLGLLGVSVIFIFSSERFADTEIQSKDGGRRILMDTDVDMDDFFAIFYLLKQNTSQFNLQVFLLFYFYFNYEFIFSILWFELLKSKLWFHRRHQWWIQLKGWGQMPPLHFRMKSPLSPSMLKKHINHLFFYFY